MMRLYKVMCVSVCLLAASAVANAKTMEKTFGMIKPSGMSKASEIKSMIASNGLLMQQSKKITMTEKQFNTLYAQHKGKPFFGDLHDSLVGKEMIVFVLYGDNAVEKYRAVVKDIRARYAINKTENAVHGADSVARAKEEICIFFPCKK